MFDGMATYLIFTGQIMGGNGLDMIVVSGEALGYRGHSRMRACTFMRRTVCVHVGVMSLFIVVVQLFQTDHFLTPFFQVFCLNILKVKVNSFLLWDLSALLAVPRGCLDIHKKGKLFLLSAYLSQTILIPLTFA